MAGEQFCKRGTVAATYLAVRLVSDGQAAFLPRSRHLPVAVTEGSLTRNVNEIGVRFWTDCSGQIA